MNEQIKQAIRDEAEIYRRRNETPYYAQIASAANKALVKHILRASDDDPVWDDFESHMKKYHPDLESLNERQLRAAVLGAWVDVQNNPPTE